MFAMGLFNKTKDDSNPFSRKADETFYQKALEELESNSINKGVYAKALADSAGDEAKAHSLYIKYRAKSLDDEQSIEILEKSHNIKIKKETERKYYWKRFFWELVIVIFSVFGLLIWLGSTEI
jgi:hypothetical protein